MTVDELLGRCEAEGIVFAARASKLISDALRWEVRAGRISRVRRGVYQAESVPRTTLQWMRHRNRQTREWLRWAEAQRTATSGAPSSIGLEQPTSWVPGWSGWPGNQ